MQIYLVSVEENCRVDSLKRVHQATRVGNSLSTASTPTIQSKNVNMTADSFWWNWRFCFVDAKLQISHARTDGCVIRYAWGVGWWESKTGMTTISAGTTPVRSARRIIVYAWVLVKCKRSSFSVWPLHLSWKCSVFAFVFYVENFSRNCLFTWFTLWTLPGRHYATSENVL